jgi:coronin-1B/1C/6
MSSKVVRSSKFRHVFANTQKPENCFNGLKASRSAWDSNKIKANTKFIGVIWEASGGGSFWVHDAKKVGRLNAANLPLIAGHKGDVLDIDFHPFNENIVASVSEDAYVKLWKVPDGGPTATITDAIQTLQGHKRKVGTCDFHPTANNVLATSSGDLDVKLWDVEAGKAVDTIKGHTDIIQCIAWNATGSQLASTCKDKKLRLADPRTEKTMQEYEGHAGVKGARVLYLGNTQRLLSVGFSKLSERQFMMWDLRNMGTPLVTENIDTAAGLIMPFYDADLNILYLGGKGDGNIRLYEVTDEEKGIYYLTQYGSNTPQRGLALAPKRAVDVSECEIDRIYKIHGDGKLVEPLHFCVPRKSDMFQEDLYPATNSGEAAMSANEWWGGANKSAPTISLEGGFVAKPATDFKPVQQAVEEGPKNEKELREAYEALKTKVAYLETELVKRDAKIAQLEGK